MFLSYSTLLYFHFTLSLGIVYISQKNDAPPPQKKDCPPICGLPPSYDYFNCPNSLLPQVPLI